VTVKRGREYATLVRNGDAHAARNFSSLNFLYARGGLAGPNAANHRGAVAARSFYGLDPREVIGYSRNAGRTWQIPGGPYGVHGGAAFIPTFLEVFADGHAAGQPFYSSAPLIGPISMSFRAARTGTLNGIGAYTSGPGAAPVVVEVNGAPSGAAELRGAGFIRADIAPVPVRAGDTITLSTTAGGDALALRRNYAGALETKLAGLGIGGMPFMTSDPQSVTPIYPLAPRAAPILR